MTPPEASENQRGHGDWVHWFSPVITGNGYPHCSGKEEVEQGGEERVGGQQRKARNGLLGIGLTRKPVYPPPLGIPYVRE